MVVIKSRQKPNTQTRRRSNNQHVKDLMAAAPDIEVAGPQPLRDSGGVDGRTGYIQHALQHDPIEPDAFAQVGDAEELDAVQYGEDGGEAHEGEEQSAEGAEGRRAELRVHTSHRGEGSERGDLVPC